ncbi:hypothetical protein AWB66_06185 [Caballeronia telluris]|uniref:Uncharacterized protein n=1 Tax=Caballeronia telluris TaxID=326475 RepID=A0A158KGI1_9BURK|nr:hypothetical protein AWB66_06185 [Caballeronia telluris]
MARLLQLRQELLRGAGIAQQRVEIGTDLQRGSVSNLRDQAADVILPAILRHASGVPHLEQRPQFVGQVERLRVIGLFDQHGNQREFGTSQCGDEFVPNHILVVVKPREIVDVRPPRADHGYADGAACQRGVDLFPPLADADAMHVAKDALAPKSDTQPVIKTAACAARIVSAIADENVVAIGGSSFNRHS